ncbi:hypothetical protein AMD27_13175 [Acinetobacter sp. TGL-Y2]|uniref:hypothetical protein n=1 Tax=Acinetobacter sp. TGL-Y2 TaxID=1407071 RepID=UPI0007A66071|nr:hypothetical protein [Acinetobacter sp. TGL-Y2]AMW79753.1 hypothetical protein AMD27_13175 [Acinetobacter sp. TGL-Y2]
MIDGIEINEINVQPIWLQVEVLHLIDTAPPLGYEWVDVGLLCTNTDLENHRIEIKTTTEDLLVFAFENPSIMQFNHRHVGVCLAATELNCTDGYLCFSELNAYWDQLTGIQQVYVPIALTENGPSITQSFTVNFSGAGSEQPHLTITNNLTAQLAQYGLYAETGINHGEAVQIGIPYNRGLSTLSQIPDFYILDEGNTFSAASLTRGKPNISCFYPM